VNLARDPEGRRVAIKRVLQDPRFRNRELQIMRIVSHPNVVSLLDYYYTQQAERNEVYLNVVMEFIPETLHRCIRDYSRNRQSMPMILVKVFMFQLLRSIGYLHLPSVNVCHRDIKPHNLLVDAPEGLLKICDFGSAKQLNPAEPNVSYICSRYYRAPELIFGCTQYSPAIDTWSVGCIFAEMLLGDPIFKGENNQQQLNEIMRVLGTPKREQVQAMIQRDEPMRLAPIPPKSWTEVFPAHVPVEAHDLCSRLLQYVPFNRDTPFQGMCHPFFDELFQPDVKLPNGKPLPAGLFRFTDAEITHMTPPQRAKLVRM
jgi:serine/threonine protein kinase